MIPVGFGNYVNKDKVLAISQTEGAPFKRHREYAADNNLLINLTAGRAALSGIYLNDGSLVLSGLKTETLHRRFADYER